MATKKKSAKRRTRKTATCSECEVLADTIERVLTASGSNTTAPATTLAALLVAARGIELVLASRPGPEGQSIYDIGAAHALASSMTNEMVRSVTEEIIAPWALRPEPRPDSKPATRKRKARK
jgi:hypothetical protein